MVATSDQFDIEEVLVLGETRTGDTWLAHGDLNYVREVFRAEELTCGPHFGILVRDARSRQKMPSE